MMPFVTDWDREKRTGIPEAVYCATKRAQNIDAIVENALSLKRALFLTRIDCAKFAALSGTTKQFLDFDPISKTAMYQPTSLKLNSSGIGVVTAGTSDIAVASEVQRTLSFHGWDSSLVVDIGVAGLGRLLDRLETLRSFRVVVALAGMEGALFSVLAGLVPAPVIAVPTSVGYGVSTGGHAALSSALASCAPGIATVNIDNGFGAAVLAMKILNSGMAWDRRQT